MTTLAHGGADGPALVPAEVARVVAAGYLAAVGRQRRRDPRG
ncbi:MAG TPA: hypothetical protein VGD43_23890 [Micromonospora sp.]